MNQQIFRHIPFSLDRDTAMEGLRVQPDDAREFEEIFNLCRQAARPKYCFAVVPAAVQGDCSLIGGLCFSSRILRVHMEGLSRAFPSLATCGREIFALSQTCGDPLQRYWIDGIAEMLLEDACERMRAEIRRFAGGQIRAVSPGSLADFPIIRQEKLFALLGEMPREIGVDLNPHCLMTPAKSVSAIYFESEEEYENCMLCLRQGCPKRRAAFSESAFYDRFGLIEADMHQKPGI